MSLEDAAKFCADAAEIDVRLAMDVAEVPAAATGFTSIDRLIGQANERARELLEAGADTMLEAAADLTAQLFQNATEA